ncbi:MAG: hydroxyethylthiazole kinase [Ornithinimicrobium sp.]
MSANPAPHAPTSTNTNTPTISSTTVNPTTVNPTTIAQAMTDLRDASPLVQCLTNSVVTGWTANVLLASGAAPAMIDNPHEAGDFARVASAVLINVGTPQDVTVAAMKAAARSAHDCGTPWVLDPVAVGPLAWRTEVARHLLADSHPTIVRGNASEILALSGGAGGRGPETVETAEDAVPASKVLAEQIQGVVAVSGPVDHVSTAEHTLRLANGHRWLTKVTGVGCALGALMAGYSAVAAPQLAAAAATAHLTVAADIAAERSAGPGSFAVALLDMLEALTAAELAEKVVLL